MKLRSYQSIAIKAEKRRKCKSGRLRRSHIGSIACNVCLRRTERKNSSKESKRNISEQRILEVVRPGALYWSLGMEEGHGVILDGIKR